MEGHLDTPKEVSRIKLEVLIRECCLIKEHLMKTFAMASLLCALTNHEMMYCSNCDDVMAENCAVPRLNLYLDYENLWMALIASMRLGFVEHQAELRLVPALLSAARSKSLVAAKSFDMEHL